MASLSWAQYLATGVPPTKKMLIGANWKCNPSNFAEVKKIVAILHSAGRVPIDSEVVVAVPDIHLTYCRDNFPATVQVAAQNVAVHNGTGAYTGEISGELYKDIGIQWTLAGHSERRVGFGMAGESNELVARKTAAALKAGLKVIACVGEHLEDREANRTMIVLTAQLAAIKDQVKTADWHNLVIAYEPVWAIGTGRVATPEQAEETHRDIRQWVRENVGADVAAALRILYGGSVKANNCKTLMACPNVDGFLVGGASLLPEFVDIMKVTAK